MRLLVSVYLACVTAGLPNHRLDQLYIQKVSSVCDAGKLYLEIWQISDFLKKNLSLERLNREI